MADHQYVPRPSTLGGGASERATEHLATQPDVRAMMRGAQEANKIKVPEAGLAGTIASDLPTLTNKGGALEAPSGGETVRRDPGSDESRKGVDKQGIPSVQQGARDRVIETEYGTAGGSYLDAARKHGAGGAGAQGHDGHVNPGEVKPSAKGGREMGGSYAMEPAGPLQVPSSTQAEGSGGDYNYEGRDPTALEEGEAPADYTEQDMMAEAMKNISIDHDKVGMLHPQKDARDFYPRADDRHNEPLSDVKHQNDGATDVCVICECSPCVCDKADRSKYRAPLEMTPAETKRGGKPALHHHDKKPITGHNAHEAHDYEAHAKTRGRQEHKLYGEGKMTYYTHGDEEKHKGPTTHRDQGPPPLPKPEEEEHTGGPVAVPDDEPQGKQAKKHASSYTGGRPLGAVEDLHLSSGHHMKPHVLG